MTVEVRHPWQTVEVVSRMGAVEVASPAYSVDVQSVVMVGGIPYRGSYEATPSEETQVIQTEGKRMLSDFTINPIPDNYGRIAYSGSGIIVY